MRQNKWQERGSNPRPSGCDPDALTNALRLPMHLLGIFNAKDYLFKLT